MSPSQKFKFLKEEGIRLAEQDSNWQAIGRWDQALELVIPGKGPQDLEHDKLWEMKAQSFITLHEWESAIVASTTALKLSPNWWCAYQTLGRAYLGFGQLKEAVLAFSKAIHINPDNEELWIEDLAWAKDLLDREKAGNREWKPIKEPESVEDDEDDFFVDEEELDRLRRGVQNS